MNSNALQEMKSTYHNWSSFVYLTAHLPRPPPTLTQCFDKHMLVVLICSGLYRTLV